MLMQLKALYAAYSRVFIESDVSKHFVGLDGCKCFDIGLSCKKSFKLPTQIKHVQ